MIPNNAAASVAHTAPFLYPDSNPFRQLNPWESGGIALRDGSKGLLFQNWQATYDGNSIFLRGDVNTLTPMMVLTDLPNITEFDFTFDSNMNPYICYVQSGVTYFYYYDTLTAGQKTITIPGAITPRLTLDDKRPSQSNNCDVILFYMKSNTVYQRIQRELFAQERSLGVVVGRGLGRVGMNTAYCLQWEVMV